MNTSAADIAAAGKYDAACADGCVADIAADTHRIGSGGTTRQTTLRALADIDAAILKSSVKDAVSLALPSGKRFADLAGNGDKTGDAFRKSLLHSRRIYEELARAASECAKYVP